jgi:CheY-like chemotaxis protein
MSYESMVNRDSSLSTVASDGRKLVLSVDDNLTILYTRYKVLSAAGYAVLSASDAAQALQMFAEHPIDLVLLDYVLPEMDGGMVADAMKTHRPDIPILMVSGVEVPEKVVAMVNGCVRKGDGAEQLISTIEKVLKNNGHAGPRKVAP